MPISLKPNGMRIKQQFTGQPAINKAQSGSKNVSTNNVNYLVKKLKPLKFAMSIPTGLFGMLIPNKRL
jgi:hypothetical protein